MIGEIMTDVSTQIALQGFFACDQSKTTSELLSHQMASLAHFVLVAFGSEVLCDKLASRNARDRD